MDRTALVTGASSGIGEATVQALKARGFTVFAAARRVERMAGLASEGVSLVAMDLTDDASITAGVAQVLDTSGRLDVLVNNAGYGSYGALEDVPLDEARRQFEVNVFGLARLCQLALPGMRARRGGRIINVSSIGGKIYEPLGSWYHATKFAVEGLSDSLRVELRPFGVDVVLIEPGAIATEWITISAQHVLAASGASDYSRRAEAVATVLNETARNPRLHSGPEVVARAIARAATVRRPRTRYVVGRGAKPIVFARRVLPDRAFDALLAVAYRTRR